MTDIQIISWIFYSIALASQKELTDIKGISRMADGINHAVPNESEIKLALVWLLERNLIIKEGTNYSLASKGYFIYSNALNESKTILNVWKNIEEQLKSGG